MGGRALTRRIAVVWACASGLGYTASKIHFAVTGTLGLPGFPAAAQGYLSTDDGGLAQLGNAGFGLVAAGLAASFWWPMRRRRIRLAVHGASWIALLALAAGWAGFTLRAFGLADGLGPSPQVPLAWLVLFLGAAWIGSWAISERLHWRASTESQ